MKIETSSVEEYLKAIPAERKDAFEKLRTTIKRNIPKGFQETLIYDMVGYVVPHDRYPGGYHVNPELPLHFCNIGSQKNFIGFYHSGLYALPELSNWFKEEYAKRAKYKLDMGKSCVRLKRMDDIPYDLIGELMAKIDVDQWIEVYENILKRK